MRLPSLRYCLMQATTRLATRMMRIAGEACFQVDANLRPAGRQGALVRTLDGHISYYKRWATTWEFQALLKARPAAGEGRPAAAGRAPARSVVRWAPRRGGPRSLRPR